MARIRSDSSSTILSGCRSYESGSSTTPIKHRDLVHEIRLKILTRYDRLRLGAKLLRMGMPRINESSDGIRVCSCAGGATTSCGATRGSVGVPIEGGGGASWGTGALREDEPAPCVERSKNNEHPGCGGSGAQSPGARWTSSPCMITTRSAHVPGLCNSCGAATVSTDAPPGRSVTAIAVTAMAIPTVSAEPHSNASARFIIGSTRTIAPNRGARRWRGRGVMTKRYAARLHAATVAGGS